MACISTYTNTDFVNNLCSLDPSTSETRILNFRIRNCTGQTPNTCEDIFNQTLCDADSEYYIPVSEQFIYLQFNFLDTLNTYPNPTIGWQLTAGDPYFVKIELTNCCCEVLEDQAIMYSSIDASNVGRYTYTDGSYRYFQNLKIETTGLPDIFGFKITDNLGNEYWTLDCYRKVSCDVGATILIESEQESGYDCSGFIYSTTTDEIYGDTFTMLNTTEVNGDADVDSYNLTKTLIRKTVLSSEINDKIKITTDIISPSHVEKIKGILATNKIHLKSKYIDKHELIFNGELNKNLTQSRMWQLQLELISLSCVLNYRCQI